MTAIEVLGEVELPVWIGNRDVLVRGITSGHVAEMLLGIDWWETQGAVRDLRMGEIYMHVEVYPLNARTNEGCITVHEPVVGAARSESHVVGSTVYWDLKSAFSTWVSKPGSPHEELRVARAIVSDRCRDVPLLIMNAASYPVRLESGEVLSDLEPDELIQDDDMRPLKRSEEPISVPNTSRNRLMAWI